MASDGSEADGASLYSVLDGSGRVVAFDSYAKNLIPDATQLSAVCVHDLVSVHLSGTTG